MLNSISNNSAVLEFDFIPQGTTVSFQYVFGSEEYPEFSASQNVNDVLGFISGPGISGPFTNGAQNIALIPTTTTGDSKVSIFNVNNGTTNNGACKIANIT